MLIVGKNGKNAFTNECRLKNRRVAYSVGGKESVLVARYVSTATLKTKASRKDFITVPRGWYSKFTVWDAFRMATEHMRDSFDRRFLALVRRGDYNKARGFKPHG